MRAYIKARDTFATVQQLNVISYSDLAWNSTRDDAGSLTVEGEIIGYEGSFLLMDGNLWLIDSLTPDNNITTVKTVNILSAFDRNLVWDASTESKSAPVRIAETFRDQYKNISDTVYAMPYLEITNTASGSACVPDTEDGLWNLKSYIRKVHRLQSIRVRFTAGVSTLGVIIENQTNPDRTVLFGDGHNVLTAQSYSRTGTAKITTVYTDESTAAVTVKDWYLDADGNISNTAPANRADGEWKVMTVNDADPTDTVTDEFAKNSKSHKIEWMSDRTYDLRDSVTTKVQGKILHTYISYVGKSSSDSRWHYKSGELATTLTEILTGDED